MIYFQRWCSPSTCFPQTASLNMSAPWWVEQRCTRWAKLAPVPAWPRTSHWPFHICKARCLDQMFLIISASSSLAVTVLALLNLLEKIWKINFLNGGTINNVACFPFQFLHGSLFCTWLWDGASLSFPSCSCVSLGSPGPDVTQRGGCHAIRLGFTWVDTPS